MTNLNGRSVSDFHNATTGIDARAGVQLLSNGVLRLTRFQQGNLDIGNEWWTEIDAGIGAMYQAIATMVSGNISHMEGTPIGSWTSIVNSPNWYLRTQGAGRSATIRVRIRTSGSLILVEDENFPLSVDSLL